MGAWKCVQYRISEWWARAKLHLQTWREAVQVSFVVMTTLFAWKKDFKNTKKEQKKRGQIAGEEKNKKENKKEKNSTGSRKEFSELVRTHRDQKKNGKLWLPGIGRGVPAGRCLRVMVLLCCLLPSFAFPCNVWSDFETTSASLQDIRDVCTGRSESKELNGPLVEATRRRSDAMGSRMRIVNGQPSLLAKSDWRSALQKRL
jgi:hypothetical protein